MKKQEKNYRILVDTGCDLDREEEKRLRIVSAPFKIDIGDKTFIDDENLDMEEFLQAMGASKEPIRTACPSPMDYTNKLSSLKEAEGIFIFTLSKKLSGSFNAAKVAMDHFKEDNPHIPICLIDTESASAGQTNLAYKAAQLIEEGLDFQVIKERMIEAVKELKTFFILESLENLQKNGRIGKSALTIANTLSIKPIMRDNGEGEIELFQINRGFKRSLRKLSDYIISEYKKKEITALTISHVNALEKANALKERVLAEVPIKKIRIVATRGLSSGYADLGGIVVAF